MGRPTYTKPDTNQTEIVDQLRCLGFDVDIICDLPGLYDIVVSGVRTYIDPYNDYSVYKLTCSVRVEIKSEEGKLSESQKAYFIAQHHRESYITAYCAADVLHWFNG